MTHEQILREMEAQVQDALLNPDIRPVPTRVHLGQREYRAWADGYQHNRILIQGRENLGERSWQYVLGRPLEVVESPLDSELRFE